MRTQPGLIVAAAGAQLATTLTHTRRFAVADAAELRRVDVVSVFVRFRRHEVQVLREEGAGAGPRCNWGVGVVFGIGFVDVDVGVVFHVAVTQPYPFVCRYTARRLAAIGADTAGRAVAARSNDFRATGAAGRLDGVGADVTDARRDVADMLYVVVADETRCRRDDGGVDGG